MNFEHTVVLTAALTGNRKPLLCRFALDRRIALRAMATFQIAYARAAAKPPQSSLTPKQIPWPIISFAAAMASQRHLESSDWIIDDGEDH